MQTSIEQKTGGIAFSVLMVGYFFVTLFFGVVASLLGLDNAVTQKISTFLPSICLFIVLMVFTKREKTNYRSTLNLTKFSPTYLVPTFLIAGGMFLGLGFTNSIFAEFLIAIGLKLPSTSISILNTWDFLFYTLSVCILPAVFEELFFRGFLLSSLKKSGAIVSSLLVALCFSLYHASLVQFIYQFIYGFLLSLLTIKSKSCIPSMIAHFLNNFTVLVLTYFFKVENALSEYYFIIVGVVFLILGIAFLFYYKREKDVKIKGEKISQFMITSIIGIVVCVLVAIIGVVGA